MGCDERVDYSALHHRCKDCARFKPFNGADLARSGECTKSGTMVRAMSANRECFQPKETTC